MTAVNYPTYKNIVGITNALQAIVDFGQAHDFTPGEVVSLRVSKNYGMKEMNNRQAKVLETTTNTITIDVNTNWWTPFVYPPVTSITSKLQFLAVCVPSSSSIVPGSNPATMNLRDSFDRVRT